MSRFTRFMAAILMILGLAGNDLRGAIIEVGITAEIAEIDDPYGLLSGQLGVGDEITGSYIYDSDTPDSLPLRDDYGWYQHSGSAYGIFLLGGGFVFQTDVADVDYLITLANVDGPPGYDNYKLTSYNNLPLYDGVYINEIDWQLDDSTGTALSSDALPTTAPVLADWTFDWGIRIDGGIPDEYGKFIESFYIRAPVSSVELIPEPGTFYYVNAADGSDDNDGMSPETPFATIQKGIDSANDGDTVIVADGTYTGEGNRDIDFLGKAITVKSESGPENCIIDCNGTELDPHRGFYFHSGEDANSILDGFTITNGHGSGIYCRDSSPTITNCIITSNSAHDGGGIHCSSSTTISNCIISGNWADRGGGLSFIRSATLINCTISNNLALHGGGGVDCSLQQGNQLIMSDCIVSGNVSQGGGGGIDMSATEGSAVFTNCEISGNIADGRGGGIAIGKCSYSAAFTMTNCLISGNISKGRWAGGGGIYLPSCRAITEEPKFSLTNCAIIENKTDYYGGGICCDPFEGLVITNCILWRNEALYGPQIHLHHSDVSVSYSDVQGGPNDVYIYSDSILNWGPGNIDADPCFVEAGLWDSNGVWVEGDYHLLPHSPCIDTGDPNYIPEPNETDLDGNPRVIGGRIDMGAYEYIPPIVAQVRISPKSLNLQSKGRWVSCYIVLPEDYNVADIDPNSILLEDEISPDRVVLYGRLAVAKFSRAAVQELLSELQTPGEMELLVSGQLTDGTIFEGTDTITIKRPPMIRKSIKQAQTRRLRRHNKSIINTEGRTK